jgi:6-phosphofructokinase 1
MKDAGFIALWCGIANGAEDILIAERYDYNEQSIIDNIIRRKESGKKHHIIVNAEGVGDSYEMAKRIEEATEIETSIYMIYPRDYQDKVYILRGCYSLFFNLLSCLNREEML